LAYISNLPFRGYIAMSVNLRTLGPAEARVVLSFREQGRDVVAASDIISLLASEQTGRKVIRNLVRKGWLARLRGGRYMLLPPERGAENVGENNPLAIASAVVQDSYVGWWSAAAFHRFTTQQPATVSVAVKRQTKTRTVEDTEIRFVTIPARKSFGVQRYSVNISDPEKIVIDCIDRPDLAGGPAELTRILHAAVAESDQKKLVDTAFQMKSTSLLQRLGFLTDLVERPLDEQLRVRLREAIPKSARSVFGRHERRDADIGYVAGWGLFVHALRSDLLSEVPRIRKNG
jgi:predicted transcriptional regulator of viral defense system